VVAQQLDQFFVGGEVGFELFQSESLGQLRQQLNDAPPAVSDVQRAHVEGIGQKQLVAASVQMD
jgi:hypothetical protein